MTAFSFYGGTQVIEARRRKLLIAVGLLLTAPCASVAQQKMKRIGLLWIKSSDDSSQQLQAFREGLRARGYIEGKNVEIVERFLVDSYPLLPEAATKLAAMNVDVIVCVGGTAIAAASKATTTIPIVAIGASNPVARGFADSLARPGKNITGIVAVNAELNAKRLELLKQIVPGLRSVAVPLNPESAREAIGFQDLERSAQSLSLELRSIPVRNLGELDAAMNAASKLGAMAFAPLPSTMFIANPRMVVSAIEKTRLPAIYPGDDFTRAGGLMSYGPRQAENFRHAAVFVDKILKGARPSDLPLEQPTRFALVINLEAAKKLGLAVPQELLLRADEVIE